jgi:hypothetical protein
LQNSSRQTGTLTNPKVRTSAGSSSGRRYKDRLEYNGYDRYLLTERLHLLAHIRCQHIRFPPSLFALQQFAMRFTLTFVAAVGAFSAATASMVARQSLPCTSRHPSFVTIYIHLVLLIACAATCLANGDFGSCSQQDNACLCKSQAFVNSTTLCIQKACQGSDLADAEKYSQAVCAAVVSPFCRFHCAIQVLKDGGQGVTLTSAGTAAASTATTPSSTSTSTAAGAA